MGDPSNPHQPRYLRELLASPWGSEDARTAALPGETIAVTVAAGGVASLWRVTPAREGWAPLDAEAKRAERHARRLAARHLHLLGAPPAGHVTLGFTRLLREGHDGRPAPAQLAAPTVEGASAGLALCLAQASLLVEQPVPVDLMGLAEVSPTGALVGVGDLGTKVSLVERRALGVRRLVVSESQAAEARTALGASTRLRVLGAKDLGEAIAQAFPELERTLQQRWSDGREAQRAVDALYRAAVGGDPLLLSWSGVARSAALLAATTELSPESRARAELTAAIATRHGGASARIPWPDENALRELRRPVRLRLLAHVVQSGADDSDQTALDYAKRAERWLGDSLEWGISEHRLAGACGRALASAGHLDPAIALLETAVAGWLDLDEDHEASHALCELVRLHGVRGNTDSLLTLEPINDRVANDPRTTDLSRAYLTLARGRAFTQAGDRSRGLALLDKPWELAPEHLHRSLWRWRALARGPSETDADLHRLREADKGGRCLTRALAELDLLLTTERQPEVHRWLDAALERERLHGHQEISRLLDRFPDQPRAVARHYRY